MEQGTSVELFVEILDRYVYYFDQANESASLTLWLMLICTAILTYILGYYQVYQWLNRAHPLEHWPAGLVKYRE